MVEVRVFNETQRNVSLVHRREAGGKLILDVNVDDAAIPDKFKLASGLDARSFTESGKDIDQ